MGVVTLATGALLYPKDVLMKSTDFLHAGTISGKLTVTSVICGWVWSKINAAFLFLGL